MRAARIVSALAVLAAGAVHLWLFAHDDYSSIHVIGPLFLLNGIAAALMGGGLLLTDAILLVLGGIGYALATLIAFVVSATAGLFGWKEVWSGTPQAVAGFTELGAFLLLLVVLARPSPHATLRLASPLAGSIGSRGRRRLRRPDREGGTA